MKRLLAIDTSTRLFAIAEVVVVTIIWSSSAVLVKLALDDMGPLSIAGLRYSFGFLLLLPLMRGNSTPLHTWSAGLWVRLFLIGISAYTIGNGAMFWSLEYLPAVTLSFLLNLIPLLVLVTALVWLREIPTRLQVMGTGICLAGGGLFFSGGLETGETDGLLLAGIGMLGMTGFAVLGREIARDGDIGTIPRSAIPLALGGVTTLLIALPLEGAPGTSGTAWGIVVWLAVVNTALGYALYNHALGTLTALEVGIILNLMPLETGVLGWLVLDEGLRLIQIVGMVIVIAGVGLVQAGAARSGAPDSNERDAMLPRRASDAPIATLDSGAGPAER